MTVRVREETHKALREISEESGLSFAEVIAQAVDTLRRQRLLEQSNEAYARLRREPRAWATEQQERALWETTLLDGMDEN